MCLLHICVIGGTEKREKEKHPHAHSPTWGSKKLYNHGNVIDSLLLCNQNLTLINNLNSPILLSSGMVFLYRSHLLLLPPHRLHHLENPLRPM